MQRTARPGTLRDRGNLPTRAAVACGVRRLAFAFVLVSLGSAVAQTVVVATPMTRVALMTVNWSSVSKTSSKDT